MTILALALFAVSSQAQVTPGACLPLGEVTAPPSGYSIDYRGSMNGAPYPVILRNEVVSGTGLVVRYHQGAGVSPESMEIDRGSSVEAIGGVVMPLRVRTSSGPGDRLWRYQADPAVEIAALILGETTVIRGTDHAGNAVAYTITFVGCGDMMVGDRSERVNEYRVAEDGAGADESKIVALSVHSGWWLREENPRTGLTMSAASIGTR